jgi:hypothetical protein
VQSSHVGKLEAAPLAPKKVEKGAQRFDYILHLLVEVHHELALAHGISEPAVGDNRMIAAF